MDSLRPDEALMNLYVEGNREAHEIVNSWKFNQPITLMPQDELEEVSERCRVTFNFPRTDGELRAD
jgi:hypothetical protein